MRRQVLGLMLAVALLGASNAYAVLIDNYNQTQGPITLSGSPATGSVNALAVGPPPLGGSRELRLNNNAGSGASSADVNSTNVGNLTFNTASGLDGELRIHYDGLADGVLSNTGLGGVNLKAGGEIGFHFHISKLDVALDVLLTVCNSTASLCHTDLFTKPPGVNFDFTHSFLAGGFVDAIVTNVGSIDLDLRGNNRALGSIDLQLDQFDTVTEIPEPTTLLMMGTGLLGLGLCRYLRRRRQGVLRKSLE